MRRPRKREFNSHIVSAFQIDRRPLIRCQVDCQGFPGDKTGQNVSWLFLMQPRLPNQSQLLLLFCDSSRHSF